jgi:oligo-1,6-glucosidase
MRKTPWWKNRAVYQIYPRSFSDSNGDGIGDLGGVVERLPYLKWLGAGVLWLSPIYPSPGFDGGYDISDYRGIHPELGTMADFEGLLAEAHRLDIRVILDLVVNHSSDQHPWFRGSREDPAGPYGDYYIWREGKNNGPPNNWGALFGGPAWSFDPNRGLYYLHLFSPRQPDLNWEKEELRREIYRIMSFWLDKGVDGFRMDVISMISKPLDFPDAPAGENGLGRFYPLVANGKRVHEFLREMRREVLDRYDVVAIGEAAGVTLGEAKKYAALDGTELDMVFQFEHMDLDGGETFKWNDRKIPLGELKRVMDKWQLGLEGTAWNSLFFCNHDQPRIVSRLGDEGKLRETSAAMLGTCLHFMKGTPFIYQGEELGMTNMSFVSPGQLRDPESIAAFKEYTRRGLFTEAQMMDHIRRKSRDNARTPMQWDAGAFAGFSTVKPWMELNPNYREINAAEQRDREGSVLGYYRKLIRLRRDYPVMVEGIYGPYRPEHPDVYAYTRTLGEEGLFIACNFRPEPAYFPPPGDFAGDAEVLIGNIPGSDYTRSFTLAPYEAVVLCRGIHKEA